MNSIHSRYIQIKLILLVKYTEAGTITIEARAFDEPHGLRDSEGIAVEIVVTDTGCGISSAKLESIFREFEQVEALEEKKDSGEGVGLYLPFCFNMPSVSKRLCRARARCGCPYRGTAWRPTPGRFESGRGQSILLLDTFLSADGGDITLSGIIPSWPVKHKQRQEQRSERSERD